MEYSIVQCIILSKTFKKFENSLRWKNRTETRYWMPIISRPSGDETLLKALTCTGEATCKHRPETLLSKAHLNLIGIVENYSVGRLIQIWIVFSSIVKELRDHSACSQHSVKKRTSLMVWGCMSASGIGSLHIQYGEAPSMLKPIQFLKQNMLP